MDISSVDLSKLHLVSARSAGARRSPKATASEEKQQVNPVAPRLSDTVSKKLDAVGKIQQVFMFAMRMGDHIQQQGILEPII